MLEIKDVSFAYKTSPVLEDISFSLKPGQHLALMGESGCGKSTLLKLIYGSLKAKAGSISWKGEDIKGPDRQLIPGASFMKYLSQDFDLMPHTSVEENISQYLSVFFPEALKERTVELLQMTDMTNFAKEKVKNLSGGQQQRVALGRVLAQKPEILLLDEPFSHIDNFRRNKLRRNLYSYLKSEGISCITATHDYHDVLPFADRVVVLRDGQVLADEPMLDLYHRPGNLYIASLFGEANVIPVEIVKSYANTKRRIIVYAHEFRVSSDSGMPVTVEKVYPMGSYYLTLGDAEGYPVYFHSTKIHDKGEELYLNVALETLNKRLTP